ncbi:putative bifunctional diguanylate cyclase/phosphodiesterase [Jatrophihabitans sp. YIM 134969]
MADVRDVALRRDLADRVFRAVRDLGAATSLDDALQRITDDVVGLLAFSGAVMNVLDDDGHLVVRAVSGPAGLGGLLGSRASQAQWLALLARCEPTGRLLFLDHRRLSDPEVEAVPGWYEEDTVGDVPEGTWHAGDTMIAPLYDGASDLVGALSVDLPAGEVQDTDQRTSLELFAAEAGSALLEWAARGESERKRADAESRFRMVWDSGLVAAAVLDEFGIVLEVNDQGAAMLGYAHSDLVGRRFLDVVPAANHDAALGRFEDLVSRAGSWVQERELQTRDGRVLVTAMHAAVTLEGEPRRPSLIVQWTDITEQRRVKERLEHQLEHDPLTDLPNRRVLERRIAALFDEHVPFGLLYGDVDGFKGVIDALGHTAGDALLLQIAARLRRFLPPEATLVRLAGDEFVALLEGESDPEVLAELADSLLGSFHEPFDLDGVPTVVQFSVGVSGTRDWHSHPVDVLREADEALARAKRRGRARVELFDPSQDRPVTRADLELEQDLRTALDSRTALEPHFQSVISLASGGTVGYESLLRWRHPRLGVLLPDRFMPVADRAGLGAALGWRVLDLVAERVRRGVAGVERPWIAVNVSAAQLGRGVLLDALRRVIDSTFREEPAGLHLEITENSLLDASPAVVDELYAAVELGARLSLDDFGTGYSSLTLLRDLPVTSIKIDRSFIAPIAVDIRARTIVQHTIELCQGLGMTTIAEGIETHEQLAWLQTLGCEYGQGFLIDRPNPWPVLDDIPPTERRRFEF